MTVQRDDNFKAGELYEPYVGRWSRAVAERFLDWLAPAEGLDWLDVGCGTGALTEAIFASRAPASVVALDPSPGFIEYARRRVSQPTVRFEVGDARAIPLAASSVDAVVSGLVLNFVPEPAQAVAEMRRVTRPGGTIAAYVWDYAGKMELMRYFWDAAAATDAKARALDEGLRFPLCRPEPLTALFGAAGLLAVETRAIDIATDFAGFDAFWSPFLGGQGPAPAYVASLDEDRRARLREELRSRLPHAADGRIGLVARAWAVRARAPHDER